MFEKKTTTSRLTCATDREIFRIRDELINNEPDSPGTFYDILGISPHASQDDITKVYRQKTKTLHPDKVKQQLKAKKKKNPNAKPPTKAELAAAVKRSGERQARYVILYLWNFVLDFKPGGLGTSHTLRSQKPK
jgi:hypothetical protein